MKKIRLIAAIALAVVIAIVMLQNTEPVQTRLLFATVEMPRALLLLTTALVGFALGVLAAMIWLRPGRPSTPQAGD